MPAKKSKSFAGKAAKKPTSGRGGGKRKKPAANSSKKQIWAIVLFALGIFIFCLTLIEGSNVWSFLRSIMFGMFSFAAYAIAPMIIYTAVILTLDRPFGSIVAKLLQGFIVVTLACSFIHIVMGGASYVEMAGENFFVKVANLYQSSVGFKSGGLVAGLIGWPLFALCGKVGAIIIILLLSFIFLMLLSGITLGDFFGLFSKPAKQISQSYAQGVQEREIKRQARFNIDVPIEDEFPTEVVTTNVDPAVLIEPAPIKANDEKIDELIKAFSPEEKDEKHTQENKIPPSKTALKKDSTDSPLLEPVTTETGIYRFPPLSLLKKTPPDNPQDVKEELETTAVKLVETLKSFGVATSITDVSRGPTVTRYELAPAAGVKISRITGLADDIALNLAASGVRIEAPIPNKAAVGIEVPNSVKSMVSIREMLCSGTFKNAKSKLTVALGKNISGEIVLADLAKMPHLLVAGSTGSGKSVCINSMIMSILYKSSPNDVRMLLIDPKMVEFKRYNGIPHLLVPVVTDPKKAAGALGWAVSEMLKRYKLFSDQNVSDMAGYNEIARATKEYNPLPQIVIIIDELADLMMAAPNEVEDSICRLAQMARAAGMHLVIATQRPSVDVITGLIKANIPSRIALTVSSQIDSRTILDGAGAEKLLGYGDMLFSPVGLSKPLRVQGCFISDSERQQVIKFITETETAEYDQQIMEDIEKLKAVEKPKKGESTSEDYDDNDPMLYRAIECFIESGQASTSLLQRRLKLGYARAARIVDIMEQKGIVGPFEGSKPRKVMITKQQFIEMTMNNTEQ